MKNLRRHFKLIASLFCMCFCMCFFMPSINALTKANSLNSLSDDTKVSLYFAVLNSGNGTTFTDESENSTEYISFNTGYDAILSSLSKNTTLIFVFDYYETDTTINLYANEYVSEINLSGLIISNENIFNIGGNLALNINASNLTMQTSVTETFAFVLNNANANISLSGNIDNSLTYFANGGFGTFSMPDAIKSDNKLKFVIPFAQSTLLFTSIENINIEEFIEVVPESDYFEISSRIVNDNYVVGGTLKVAFETNGGTLDSSYELPTTLNFREIFADSSQIYKQHCSFEGWFAKIEFTDAEVSAYNLLSNTYYFDKIMADNFLASDMNYSDINNCFVTSTDNLNASNAFLGYNSEDSHANIFINLKKIPTYSAVWSENIYTISFISNGGNSVSDLSAKFDEQIVLPTPSKAGHNFEGWFTDQALTKLYDNSNKMPGQNITLYAKWSVLSYTITFKNNDNIIDSFSTDFGETITYPVLDEVVGLEFIGWFTIDDIKFDDLTMPNKNLTLIAKWSTKKYSIYINSMGGQTYSSITLEYGSIVPPPANPTKAGAIFDGWYADSSYNIPFSFENLTMPAKNQTIFAKWKTILYYLHFVTNTSQNLPSLSLVYGESIVLPTPQAVKGKTFGGWYSDINLTNKFETSSMPNSNITIYALWNDKLTLSIDTSAQTYEITNYDSSFNRFSELDGFRVQYKVDGEWTYTVPTKVGTYDVKVQRNEDNVYAEFETIIEKGFTITGEKINLSWLIIILFIITGLELVACIIIRALRQMKHRMTLTAFVPLFGFMLPTEQFVLLIISGVLALFMFVLTIYELVKLINTLPEVVVKRQKQSEMNYSEEVEVFESITEDDGDHKEFKQEEAFGSKYSALDIQKLLYKDDYRSQHTANIVPDKKPDNKPYESATIKAKQNSINRKFEEDDKDDSIELQDKNGHFEKRSQNISKIKTYDQEFDDWRSKIQTDIPED